MTIEIRDPAATPARNLELKVAVTATRLEAIIDVLGRAGVGRHDRQAQVDTYFTVPTGRLKLRTIRSAVSPPHAELIGYRRGDVAGSRWSNYQILPLAIEQAEAMAAVLGQAMDVWIRVCKQRDIYLIGQTRVHLDTVDRLGTFVELETVITNQLQADAEREHVDVLTMLSLGGCTSIAGSYSDLLARGPATDNAAQ